MTDWETQLRTWSKPSSDTEAERIENAERVIRAAIQSAGALASRSIKIFTQGSYRNNTNVRLDSDIDIVVCCSDSLFFDFGFAESLGPDDVGISTPAPYPYSQFRDDVGTALTEQFGSSGVTRGNKAFDVHANSYRVDADVVAAFEHRRYRPDGKYEVGIGFVSDEGTRIENWPEQHYDNGVAKNLATAGRYKFMVRALKNLRNSMHADGIPSAAPIPSFLIECLVWNVPNEGFGHDAYVADMRYVLAHTFNATLSSATCTDWGEVSEHKYLFKGNPPWTRNEAHYFLSEAWDYLGFE